MFLDSVRVDDFIVKIIEARFPPRFSQYDVEGSLQGHRSVCKANGYEDILVGSGVSEKHCFRPIFLPDRPLPIS